ncbi:DMT family transporter [Neptuniibacter sp. CAU 1671]|uniref:DMT family transporter n=1 Tax=Neptuniibacter sp. CAU 1671 TaxID=3032593 RepID=UPI0023DA7F21|nr:DMT family transporter [Neptuniibacter sp. CAU 1671]MDF2182482.1 DMT family transporter [Neptuniibacter sp. CAU 1671]
MGLTTGVRYMLLSALGFALMAACVKSAATRGIPVLEIVAFRAIVSLALSYLDIKRKRLSVWGNNKPLLIARGTVGALALMCVFYAVSTLPLAEATVLQYTYPAFTALIALWFLKERIQFATLLCIGMSIAGVIAMMQPNLRDGIIIDASALSIAAALLGALGSAVAYVIVRHLSRTEDSSVIIFYFPLIAFPLSVVLLHDNFVIPNLEALALLILVGIFTQIGQIGLTKAMAVEKAGKAAAYAYVQVVFSAILGWALFAEVPTLWTAIGGLFIISGALINTFYKR